MGRAQSFDRAAVVGSARTLFWQVGFDGAAIPELEAATGIRRSSMYHAFGSKRGLFDAVVQSYLDEVVRPRLRPLQVDDVEADAILEYLAGLRDVFAHPDSMPASHGCLLINTAGGPIARDPQIARVIAEYRGELETAFARGIRARFSSMDHEARSRLGAAVTGLVITAFALARVDSAQAVRSIEAALGLLEPMV